MLSKNIITYLFLFLILLGAFFVRLYKIDNPVADWHSWRQADTASVTRIYVENGIDLFHPRYHDLSYLQTGVKNPEGWRFVELPIYNVLHTVLVKLLPQYPLEILGRLLSIISSLVSLVLLFVIGKRFINVSGGLAAAFIFAFMPYNIYFSRVILPEPLSVALILASITLFIFWHDKNSVKSLYLSSIFFCLALLVKPYTIFYGVVLFWLALNKHSYKLINVLKDKNLWTFLLVALIPLIGWRLWMREFSEGIPFHKWVFNLEGIRFKPSFWYWIFGERLGKMMLGVWMSPLFIAGLLTKSKNNEFKTLIFFGLAAFLYVSVIAAANVRHDYYQTIVVPVICLLVAKGFIYFWETTNLIQPVTRITAVFLILSGLYFPWNQIKGLYQINHPEIIRAGNAVNKVAASDALIVAPYNGDTALLYQTKRSGWPYQGQPIEELVQSGADYYVSVNLNDPQTLDAVKKFEVHEETEEYIIVDLNRKRMPKN